LFTEYLKEIKNIKYCAKEGARVLVRIDINSPLDPKTKEILDDYRFQAHAKTIDYLVKSGCRVVILAHQGRPGREDFTSLEKHKKVLEKYLGYSIDFIDDVMGPSARERIKSLKPGEVLLLDNVRFISEEVIERKIEAQANTYLVRKLAPLFDYFVFDGFAVAHRAQPSVVGFPLVLPSCMGLVLEDELKSLAEIEQSKGRAVLVAGGAKVPETLRALEEALRKNLFSKVLVGGLLGVVFIAAKYGFLTSELKRMIENYGLLSYVDYAKTLLNNYSESIEIPTDVAINVEKSRIDVDVYSISNDVMDIGSITIRNYIDKIREAEIVVFSGPLGYIEDDNFIKGTATLLQESISMNKKVIIAGGHTIALARKIGLINKVTHVSTGGRAFLESIVGRDLPALRALRMSCSRNIKKPG